MAIHRNHQPARSPDAAGAFAGRSRRVRRTQPLRVAAALCGAVALGAGASTAEGPLLVAAATDTPPQVQAAWPEPGGPPSKRQRLVTVDTRRLAAPAGALAPTKGEAATPARDAGEWTLRINLFDDVSFHMVVERAFPLAAGHALRGTLQGIAGGRGTLAVRGDTVTGTLLTPKTAYVIRPAGGGRHAVAEVDRAWFPPHEAGRQWRLPPAADAPVRMFEQHGRTPPPAAAPPSAVRVRKSAPVPIARGHRASGVAGFGGRWVAQGPGPILYGQVENVAPNNEVVGAVHTVLAHPTDRDILYIGATNGGIWRTDDATSLRPTWRPLTDHASSLSIGAMVFDAEDVNTIVAGIGRYSSFGGAGGDRTGLLLSRDAGETWREVHHPFFGPLQNVSGLAVRGDRIVATAALFSGGVFRSTDGGATWATAADLPPATPAFDLVVDPRDADRLYLTMQGRGVFRSDDGGASWHDASSNDLLLSSAFRSTVRRDGQFGDNNNAELAVGADGRVFVAVLVAGQANYIGFTDDQGSTWTAMDLPLTLEVGDAVDGLNPRFKPGAQGAIHFSILVDPEDSDRVYVGGDRQNLHFVETEDGNFLALNSLGAFDYSGRLFRGDAGVPATGEVPSPQWEHLTHRADVAAIPGGGTANSSSPHADSREMVLDAGGDLIQVDDGGVYRRTSPKDNTGDWFSLNGNLQVSEMHDIAYDPVAKMLIGGNQDTGTPDQQQPGPVWITLSSGDGGDVAVDASEAPEQSYRYSSHQFFSGFRRTVYAADGRLLRFEFPALEINGEYVYDLDPNFGFVQHFSLNAVDPRRAVIGAASVYETFDRFETLTEAASLRRGAQERATATAYGCPGNPDLLYFGHGSSFNRSGLVTVRRGLGEDDAPTPDDLQVTGYIGGSVRGLVIDQDDCDTVYAIDDQRVHTSNDGGETWRDITGNLADAPVNYADLNAIEIIPAGGFFGLDGAVAVGGRGGVHVMFPRVEGFWFAMNDGLPHAPVWDMDYSTEDNVLFAATLGRSAWRLDPGPQVVSRIADQALEVADGATAVGFAGVFADADTDGLVYSAESGNDAVATVTVDGDRALVTPKAAGATVVRLIATNAAGLRAVATFRVNVGAVVDIPPAVAVREGDLLLLPLRLSRPLRSLSVLRYVVAEDDNAHTADASPDDYFATGYLVLNAGTTRASIFVRINEDADIEPPREAFQITLAAPAPNADVGLGLRHSTTVTIKEGVCDRSPAVRDALRAGRGCADVADVSAIANLDLSGLNIGYLKAQDFAGMSGLADLNLSSNQLAALPAGIFARLANLRLLNLADNELTSLPFGAFFQTPNLLSLRLSGNGLTTLAPSVFFGNPTLMFLFLDDNMLQELPPSLLFAQSVLRALHLQGNRLDALPDGFFGGLVHVSQLNLTANPGTPFTLALDLIRTDGDPADHGPAEVALHVRQGTPFDITASVTVDDGLLNATTNGTTATIHTGQLVSEPFQVAQSEGKAATVRVAEDPPVPAGECEQEACYEGVAIAAGEPLVLFGGSLSEGVSTTARQ